MARPADEEGDRIAEKASLDSLTEKLDRARSSHEHKSPMPRANGAALGRAMRVSTELVAGLLVGTLLGVFLDRAFSTAPWFLLVGIGIGFAAGLRNLSRALSEEKQKNLRGDE